MSRNARGLSRGSSWHRQHESVASDVCQLDRHLCQLSGLGPSRAGSLDLVGCELAWDFTNTSSGRASPAHKEHLRDFETLMQWVEHARVATPPDCAYMRAAVEKQPRVAKTIFKRVLEVRELIWTIGTALAEQRPVADELRASLTAAHAESLRFAEMRMRDGVYIWTWDPRKDVKAAILGPITLSALTLLMEKDLSRTKRCQGKECGWLFFDTTKNKRRLVSGARPGSEPTIAGDQRRVL
jgi:predicted RNA-binding Zn ribbon-like protein